MSLVCRCRHIFPADTTFPQAAALPVPEVENTSASTASLVDVDAPPSVRTVPSEFGDSVTTETAENEAADPADPAAPPPASKASQAAAAARAKTEDTARKAAAQARAADRWVTDKFSVLQEDHPTATQAVVLGNLAAVAALSTLLGVRAWGLVEQGRFNWKIGAVGLGVLGAVGLLESALAK